MMKSKISFAFAILAFLFISYNSFSIPRNHVMEFSTGTWCGFCPCGELVADSIINVYPNTVIVGYHSGGNDPFVFSEATTIFNAIGYGASPTLCLDRSNHPGDPNHTYISYMMWSNFFYQRYLATPDALIDVVITTKDYNTSTRVLNATINATALQNLTGQYKIHFELIENFVVYPQNWYQACGNDSSGYHANYVHRWIPRAIINGVSGQTLNTGGVWNQNQTITKSFSYTLSSAWVPGNCDFIAIVYKDSSAALYLSEVQQAIRQSVTNPLGVSRQNQIPAQYSLAQNYPNPFNPTTNIKFSIPKDGNASLKIYDILGNGIAVYLDGFVKAGTYNAEIDASRWSSGIYFYKLTATGFTETKKMMLVK
ncbi:MAG: Omp28-related outer membrane protein [Ignavibacteria bacterium]